jgi:hypothetical protein
MQAELQKRFGTEAKMLSVFRERAKAEAKRWVYSTEEIWSYEDLRARGSESSLLPGPEGALFACGYDAAERAIVLQQFEEVEPETDTEASAPTKEICVEEFIAWSGDTLDVTRFVRGELHMVCRSKFQDRLLVEDERVRHGVYQHERIQYQGRRMRLEQFLSHDGRVVSEIAYGPHGEQTFYKVRRDGTRFELYQPLPKGMTVKSLKESVRSRLLALVPELVARARIAEPLYCVALAYDAEGGDALPPLIGIGLESERQRWKAQHGKKAWQWLWNPAEFQHYEKEHTQLEDDALEEACDYLNGKMAENGSAAPAIKLLLEVAGELNRSTWPKSIRHTADFTVYAVDLELAHLRKNLKQILSVEKLNQLKKEGLL